VKLTSSREEQEAKNRARQNKILKYIYKKKKKNKKTEMNFFKILLLRTLQA
jgi:hypothetical protein